MNTQAKLLAAYALATQKQFEQASAVLGPLLPTAQPVERDLRARILFALGDEAGAEALWNDLLVADPSNRRAQGAIGYLRRVQRRRRLFRPVKNAAFWIQRQTAVFCKFLWRHIRSAGVFFWKDVKKTFGKEHFTLRRTQLASLRQRAWRLLRNVGLWMKRHRPRRHQVHSQVAIPVAKSPENDPSGNREPEPSAVQTEEERFPEVVQGGNDLHQSAHTENPIEQGSSNENAMGTKRDDA